MMSPFDDTAGMASEQSSREVLNCPLVAALTPTMSDAAIRAARFGVGHRRRVRVSFAPTVRQDRARTFRGGARLCAAVSLRFRSEQRRGQIQRKCIPRRRKPFASAANRVVRIVRSSSGTPLPAYSTSAAWPRLQPRRDDLPARLLQLEHWLGL